MDFEKQITDDLHRYLTAERRVDERLPECPDLQEIWHSVAEAYMPDGVREFTDYPMTSLGWIMFVGMALAKYWDTDWEHYSKRTGAELYTELRDAKGFDSLDDHVLLDILGLDSEEADAVGNIVGECAARSLSALRHSGIEPGTSEAARAYIATLHALYTMGIALELNALGYHMTPIGFPPPSAN